MSRIMLVDDDVAVRRVLAERLTSLKYDVVGQAESAAKAVEMARTLKPDVILMDIVMPGQMDGISAAEQIKRETDVVIIFLTGYGNTELLERAKRTEPYGYLMKP